jgi:hypothetical protein
MVFRLLLAMFLAQSLVAAGQLTFSGRVSRGAEFSYRLDDRLWFCLHPEPDANGGGWSIAVAENCDSDHDFVAVATPPMRGVNAREIEAWHFDPGANAPQTVRDFAFVLRERDWNRLATELNSSQDARRLSEDIDALGRGHGALTITKMHRHATSDGKSVFDWMQFHVVIKLPVK